MAAPSICCWPHISSSTCSSASACPASLELDEGQQLFLAQWLATGYDTQPPFYNWLQYGVVQIFGSTALAVSPSQEPDAVLLLPAVRADGQSPDPRSGPGRHRNAWPDHHPADRLRGAARPGRTRWRCCSPGASSSISLLRPLRQPSALNYALCGIAARDRRDLEVYSSSCFRQAAITCRLARNALSGQGCPTCASCSRSSPGGRVRSHAARAMVHGSDRRGDERKHRQTDG